MSQPATPGGQRTAATRIAAVRPRERVTVTGTVRSAAAETIGSSPAFRCVIADGSGEIEMVFLGRRHVTGLTLRRRCTAEGRACVYRERLVIWNPRYTLDPAGEASPLGSGAGRVLVVGDDPGMCRIIEVNLARRGHQVDVAATIAEATCPDLRNAGLIIVDIGPDQAAGLTTISALRDVSAAPILTISALDGEPVARAAASAGSDDFLPKPFPISALLRKVATHLESMRQR